VRARFTDCILCSPSTPPTIFCVSFLATRYTKEHEAIVFDSETGVGVVSITEHAQESLGDVVFVELPVVGTKVAKGGEYACFWMDELWSCEGLMRT